MKRDLSCILNCHIVFDQPDSSWQEKTRCYFATQLTSSRRVINPFLEDSRTINTSNVKSNSNQLI